MHYILIAFLSPFFHAFANLIECNLSNRIFKHQMTMIFYISMMNAVYLPLLLFFGMPSIPTMPSMICFVLLGVIDVLYLYPYYTALKVIDTSIVGALFSLGQITIPIMTYLVLGEELGWMQYMGFLLIILSSIALSITNLKLPKLNRAFYYMLVVSLLRAGYVVLQKYALVTDGSWINVTIYPNLISGFLPLFFLFNANWRRDIAKSFKPYLQKFKFFAVNEFFCFLGLATSVYALSGISAVTSASIGATAPMFMLLFGFILCKKFACKLDENLTGQEMTKKMICFSIIVIGVFLVVQ